MKRQARQVVCGRELARLLLPFRVMNHEPHPGSERPPTPGSRLPPPLPLPAAYTETAARRAFLRKMSILALFAALIVVAVPIAYVIHLAQSPGGPWQKFREGFHSGYHRKSRTAVKTEASSPIPRPAADSTEETDRRAALAWARRTMLAGFDQHGRHHPHWDADAHAFIDRALPWWAGLHDCPLAAADLLPQARNVLHEGCDDPLVCYLAGIVEARADGQSPSAGPLLSRAVAGFQQMPYARGVAWIAAAEMVADCERRRDGTDQSKPVKQWWFQWFRESLGDGSFGPDEQPVLAMQLSRGEGAALFEAQRDACCREVEAARAETVAPWLRRLLAGNRHLRDAWDARGGGYADTVSEEGWRGFRDGLALARRDLVASWQANPQRPEAAALMISVALGQSATGADGPRAWFDRAARAQVDYAPAYERMYNTLLPQWGGSREAMLAFGLACADTRAYDTGVPIKLNEAANGMEPDESYRNPQIYAALERMYAGYEAAPSQVGRRAYYHAWHARAAELNGEYTKAYQLLKEVNFWLPTDLTTKLAYSRENTRYAERIAAYGAAGGADAVAGDRLAERGDPGSALERFRRALSAEGAEPRAATYLRDRIAGLETARRLAAGNWISFQPIAGDAGAPVGWTSKLGSWRVAPDGALIGYCGAKGLMLVSDTPVGDDFEMRGDLDFLPGALSEQQSGVMFGHPDMDRHDWQSFRLKRHGPDGAVATVSCHWYDGPKQPIAVPDHNAFLLQAWHGNLTLVINGAVVFNAQRLDRGQVTDGSSLVGLGGYSHQGNTYTVSYRNLQIRRLAAAPPGKAGESVAAR